MKNLVGRLNVVAAKEGKLQTNVLASFTEICSYIDALIDKLIKEAGGRLNEGRIDISNMYITLLDQFLAGLINGYYKGKIRREYQTEYTYYIPPHFFISHPYEIGVDIGHGLREKSNNDAFEQFKKLITLLKDETELLYNHQ